MKEVIILYDYADDTKLASYIEVLKKIKDKDSYIVTNCITFFNFNLLDKGYDVKVVKKNGEYILLSELLHGDSTYTEREIRKTHNVYKMLIADCFSFKKPL